MKLTIYGRIPSKKNSKRIIVVRGRPLIMSSKEHESWKKEQLIALRPYKGVLKGHKGLKIHFNMYAPDLRSSDLSNKFESIADILVDAEIIDDDNWEILENVFLHYKGLDRENPRVEIEII